MTTHGGPGLGARFRQHYAEQARKPAETRWGGVAVVPGGQEKVRRTPGMLRTITNGPDGAA